jgi:hypothetical protein
MFQWGKKYLEEAESEVKGNANSLTSTAIMRNRDRIILRIGITFV